MSSGTAAGASEPGTGECSAALAAMGATAGAARSGGQPLWLPLAPKPSAPHRSPWRPPRPNSRSRRPCWRLFDIGVRVLRLFEIGVRVLRLFDIGVRVLRLFDIGVRAPAVRHRCARAPAVRHRCARPGPDQHRCARPAADQHRGARSAAARIPAARPPELLRFLSWSASGDGRRWFDGGRFNRLCVINRCCRRGIREDSCSRQDRMRTNCDLPAC